MVKAKNVLLVSVSLVVPFGAYTLLVNRRLERRLRLVEREHLPDAVTKVISVPGRPKLNYVEGFYADLPASRLSKSPTMSKVEDFARVFWSTPLMILEWKLLSGLDRLGIEPFEKRIDPSTKSAPDFTKGKPIMDGVFVVEKGVEEKDPNELLFSYWTKPREGSMLHGGLHALVCEKLDGRNVRIWFVSHLALNHPSSQLVADDASRVGKWSKLVGYDPNIVDPTNQREVISSTFSKVSLWFHRLYSRILLDAAIRQIGQRK